MIYVDAPEGFEMPDGVKPGREFEVVASITMSKDGRISIVSLDGMDIGSEKEEDDDMDEDESEDPSGGFLSAMEKRMSEADKK